MKIKKNLFAHIFYSFPYFLRSHLHVRLSVLLKTTEQ